MEKQIDERLSQARSRLIAMITSEPLLFDSSLRSRLPNKHGLYRIYFADDPGGTIRAGRTKRAASGLQQRVYQNHYKGNQPGNTRQQLVRSGRCPDLAAATQLLEQRCRVQLQVVEDDKERSWAEHFMLSILCPEHCD